MQLTLEMHPCPRELAAMRPEILNPSSTPETQGSLCVASCIAESLVRALYSEVSKGCLCWQVLYPLKRKLTTRRTASQPIRRTGPVWGGMLAVACQLPQPLAPPCFQCQLSFLMSHSCRRSAQLQQPSCLHLEAPFLRGTKLVEQIKDRAAWGWGSPV